MNNNDYFYKLIVIATSCLNLMQSTVNEEETVEQMVNREYQVCLQNQVSGKSEILRMPALIRLTATDVEKINAQEIDESIGSRLLELIEQIPTLYHCQPFIELKDKNIRIQEGTIIIPYVKMRYYVEITEPTRESIQIVINGPTLGDGILLSVSLPLNVLDDLQLYLKSLPGEKLNWSGYFNTIQEVQDKLEAISSRSLKTFAHIDIDIRVDGSDFPDFMGYHEIPGIFNAINYIKEIAKKTNRDFDDMFHFFFALNWGLRNKCQIFRLGKHKQNRYSIDVYYTRTCSYIRKQTVIMQFFFIDKSDGSNIGEWYKEGGYFRVDESHLQPYQLSVELPLPANSMFFEYCQVGEKIYRPESESPINFNDMKDMAWSIIQRLDNICFSGSYRQDLLIDVYKQFDLDATLREWQERKKQKEHYM